MEYGLWRTAHEVRHMAYGVVKRVKHLREEVAGTGIDNIHFAGSSVNK